MQTLLTIALGLFTLMTVSLQRTYSSVPLNQLKHRARSGDELAKGLVKAVSYGHSLRAVLWFLIGLSASGFFIIITLSAPVWFAFIASGIIIWLGFVWIPAARVTFVSEKLAVWCAPIFGKILSYLHPILDRIIRLIRRHKPLRVHTGLYDRRDLIDLLETQQVQPDNRIEKSELNIALHALRYGDDTVVQHMTPRRVVKAVSVDEPLGPIIMDELHASGYSRFPVYEGKKDNLVGILYLRDLLHSSNSGTVRKLVKNGVAYIHENQSLHDVLQAILKTHRQMFVVVNSFEEYIGIITIEDVLETILGAQIVDEFDQYEDMRAVAAHVARKDHIDHIDTDIVPDNPTPESSEVVE